MKWIKLANGSAQAQCIKCGAVCFFPYGPAANILSVGGWNTRCTLHKSEGEVTRSAAHLTV